MLEFHGPGVALDGRRSQIPAFAQGSFGLRILAGAEVKVPQVDFGLGKFRLVFGYGRVVAKELFESPGRLRVGLLLFRRPAELCVDDAQIQVRLSNAGGKLRIFRMFLVKLPVDLQRAGQRPLCTFTAADAGVHTFTATLNTAGTQSITGTDTLHSTITGTQSGIQVTAAPAGCAASDALFAVLNGDALADA
jgi:hypothetical protein